MSYTIRDCATLQISPTERESKGVVVDTVYFGEVEDELFVYQLNHPEDFVPFVFFWNDEHFDTLNREFPQEFGDFHVLIFRDSKYKELVQTFIREHPEWKKIVVRYI